MAMRYSVRRDAQGFGVWKTVFQGSASEVKAYLRTTFTNPGSAFRAGVFRLYGGEGATRAKIGVRNATKHGLL